MLKLKNIKKDYITSSETVNALRGVSISFRQSEFVSILGPSGCGKTTLLNIIGGLDHYTDGDLIIGGRSTKSYKDRDWDIYRNHRIGFIFQSYNLIPHQTVLGNVELALTIAGIDKEERIGRAKRALDRVGLAGQYYKKPNQLSGGQCQRVAIARALVNDPEILLADEPTGALDTVTSVQIMDLIKEISNERLVIMVTHNPELAQKYSSRIVRLLDGEITEDTNPMSDEEEALEIAKLEEMAKSDGEEALKGVTTPKERGKIERKREKKRERAKMSFLTAFRLSARNLLSKRGRTAMVGIAGSIGIIGIALVLAFSAGIRGYIASMQDDMLSGNPVTVSETAYDLNSFSNMIDNTQKEDIIKNPNRVYINSLIEYLIQTRTDAENIIVENELTEQYLKYVAQMPEEYYSDMLFQYGVNINSNLYTDISTSDGETHNYSISHITALYTAILEQSEYGNLSYLISYLAPSIQQAPSNNGYIMSQYDVLAGKLATGKNEIMLVVDRDDELSDLLLARYGYYTQDEFLEIINKANANGEFESDIYKDSFAYDELVGKKFTYYKTNDIFKEGMNPNNPLLGYNYAYDSKDITGEGIELTVVGILSPKDSVSYGCLSSGIYYTEALTDYVLDKNANAEDGTFMSLFRDSGNASKFVSPALGAFGVSYNFSYTYDNDNNPSTDNIHNAYSAISYSTRMSDAMGGMMGGGGASPNFEELMERMQRTFGGNDMANSITIFPVDFDLMAKVTEYLEDWNRDIELTIDGTTVAAKDRSSIMYNNTLELVIGLVDTMISIVTYALVAFTSISLVVSTVMIGIITYVSVVERTKEIGVIRSLGGRKKDVSYLFNAETFIIGLLAGLLGIVVTYLISIVVNLILEPLIGYSGIAALPASNAIILVLLSVALTLISGLIPASSAAKKDPVVALRTE